MRTLRITEVECTNINTGKTKRYRPLQIARNAPARDAVRVAMLRGEAGTLTDGGLRFEVESNGLIWWIYSN